LRYWALAVGGRGRCGGRGCCTRRVLCWGRVGRRLYLCWARLLLEDGVVAETLALALLAISADGVGFVAL
jgi:hypothetical protein